MTVVDFFERIEDTGFMKNHLIIHGHFYQPPREDPETGVIPLQESASPYHDWNCRITKECYGANSASRILDAYGKITDIINNYRYMSFNFGPTLLDWLESHSPNVYSKIVQADKESAARNRGHGNALAQSYNHTILPLDTPEDANIQIHWGIDNFRHHFGRNPEGMWLPETAVNMDIIDLLITRGIKFIILSPWQVQAIRAKNQSEWQFLNGKPGPSSISCFIQGEKGSITAFFYNPDIASGISFEHYLRNADQLYSRLLHFYNAEDPSNLVHTATDGEIYGHHEPFGDMCLASLIKKVQKEEAFILSNYGMYLEEFPPETEALLLEGEERKGTSWSCVHGVCRWFKDCGCTTGGEPGWNQKWRTPLRDAFTFLSGRLIEEYTKQMELLSEEDPFIILSEYSAVCNKEVTPEAFSSRYLHNDNHSSRVRFLKLLEGQRYRLYMFTSCGWFFSDIAGLEPVQNMRYAQKAFDLYTDYLSHSDKEKLLTILDLAQSNKPDKGTGKNLFLSLTHSYPEGFKAALYFYSISSSSLSLYGKYILRKRQKETETTVFMELINSFTTETFSYRITFPDAETDTISIILENTEKNDSSVVITDMETIDPETRANLLDLRIAATTDYTLSDLVFILKYSQFLKVQVPDSFRTKIVDLIASLLREHLTTSSTFIPDEVFNNMCTLIHLADQLKLSYDRTIPQNILFSNLSAIRKAETKQKKHISQMIELSDILGIYCEDLKIREEASGQQGP